MKIAVGAVILALGLALGKRSLSCPYCTGSGSVPGPHRLEPCRHCGGRGWSITRR